MSFSLTTAQVRARTKTVTRRLRWINLQPGTLLCAVVKGMGLKKGEQVEQICTIRVTAVRRERLSRMLYEHPYGLRECEREGFPELQPAEFLAMFTLHNGCSEEEIVTRIEFEYV